MKFGLLRFNPELRSIQDVGYYAPRGPNLSKLCATCLFLRVTDLGKSHSSTSGTPLSRLPV
jgi:hypothetical protein